MLNILGITSTPGARAWALGVGLGHFRRRTRRRSASAALTSWAARRRRAAVRRGFDCQCLRVGVRTAARHGSACREHARGRAYVSFNVMIASAGAGPAAAEPERLESRVVTVQSVRVTVLES
jgi:hypothetical protein